MTHAEIFFAQAADICNKLDVKAIDLMAQQLATLREQGGRLFVLGVGGSAANASHAVNDFRKLCNIETYAPTDNVSELTARTNDEGWDTVFSGWLQTSRPRQEDALLIFSVGGGNAEQNVSLNLIKAINFAKEKKMKVFGVVGRDGGHTAKVADVAVVIPTVDQAHVTPYTEAFQALVWHCLVSNPVLQVNRTKW